MLTTGPFVKLFIANRFSKCNISSKLKHFDGEEQKLLNSLRKQGLKNYLQNDGDLNCIYDQTSENNRKQKDCIMKTHNIIITETVSKIMCHCPKLYQSITSYTKNQTYYDKVFNINQLPIYIFQYLNTINSLINCSMVDSIWLIYAFHANCAKNCN